METELSRAGRQAVGVITLPGCFNYGNRLQNYAVERVWQKLGYTAQTLLLEERPNVVRSAARLVARMLGRGYVSPESLMSPERLAAFGRFNEAMHIRKLEKPYRGIQDEYAYFSVGSDQVWNPFFNAPRTDRWYYLEFARPEQRIALAPSIGLDSLDPRQAERVSRGVRGFDHPSVRERRGAELIRECSGVEAEVLCDPTLVLTAEEWRSVADGRCTPEGPYVFTYLLGGRCEEADAVLREVTDGGRIPVVALSDREKPGEPPAGPAEFIDILGHAEHVVTDSFHGSVFSTLMRRPLTITRRGGTGRGMHSRLQTLAEMLGIGDKLYGGPEFDLARAGVYQGVDEALARERGKFMGYLEGRLHA